MTGLLQDFVSEQAQWHPEAVAIVDDKREITYGYFDTLSNRIARAIKKAGCKKGDRVCILQDKTAFAVVSIVATLKADCIYVPLNPGDPINRIKRIFNSCKPKLIIADRSTCNTVTMLTKDVEVAKDIALGCMDYKVMEDCPVPISFNLNSIESYSDCPLNSRNNPEDPVVIMYTSGSTGEPKGVIITHSNICSHLNWAIKYYDLDCCDRVASFTPLFFDVSTFDIFGSFAAGCQLHIVPTPLGLAPKRLLDFMRHRKISLWASAPSIPKHIAKRDLLEPGDLPALRHFICGGEVLPTPVYIYWISRLPHVTFTNAYGPTETTVMSPYYRIPGCPENPQENIPIGIPCCGEVLYVLDEHMKEIPQDTIGDLYIQGSGVSPGYWNDPEKTAEAFLEGPLDGFVSGRIYKTGDLARIGMDGLLYFVGRKDTQIKSRGYRIELGEIEKALSTLDILSDSAIVSIESNGVEGQIICCAYQAADSACNLNFREINRYLVKIIPTYMLPARYMSLRQYQGLPTGKTDREKVKLLFMEQESIEGRKDFAEMNAALITAQE